MPCSGPRTLPFLRSTSSCRASSSAFLFNVMIALMTGPFLSYASIRLRYALTGGPVA